MTTCVFLNSELNDAIFFLILRPYEKVFSQQDWASSRAFNRRSTIACGGQRRF